MAQPPFQPPGAGNPLTTSTSILNPLGSPSGNLLGNPLAESSVLGVNPLTTAIQGPSRASPPVTVEINNQPLLASGTVVVTRDDAVAIRIGDLTFEFRFEDTADDKQDVSTTQVSPTWVAVRLINFKSALGTTLGPLQVGTLQHRPLILGLFVESVGERNRVLSYSFYEGR